MPRMIKLIKIGQICSIFICILFMPAGGFAEITYCNYGMDGKLHVRDGYPKLFKPIKLLWGNGFIIVPA